MYCWPYMQMPGVRHVMSTILMNTWNLGKQLRALLYQNDMSMELVNMAIERESTQEPPRQTYLIDDPFIYCIYLFVYP